MNNTDSLSDDRVWGFCFEYSGWFCLHSRYLAICHSFKYFLTTKVARIIITSIWLFAVTVMTPWAVSYRQEATPTEHDQPPQPPFICIQRWPSESVERIYFLGRHLRHVLHNPSRLHLGLLRSDWLPGLQSPRPWRRFHNNVGRCQQIESESAEDVTGRHRSVRLLMAAVVRRPTSSVVRAAAGNRKFRVSPG